MPEDMPGRLLTAPNLRGRLRVTPIYNRRTQKSVALRIRVFTELGLKIADIRATDGETTVVQFPDPKTGKLVNVPGSFWFYGLRGVAIGFLADQNAGALAKPMAVETAPKGPGGKS